MSNWPSPAPKNTTVLDEWNFSPRLRPVSTVKQEFLNQLSTPSSSMICTTNNVESGSKLLTPFLLSHFAVPVFSRPSIELPKNALAKCSNTDTCNLAPHLNLYLQNGLNRTQTNSQSLCLPSTSSNDENFSKNKKARNCKIDAFSIESLLGKTNPSRTIMNIKLSERSFPKVSQVFL
ncbi:unnamed protein product [Cercopithifilaria johnstoni]|uniref:Uncharacterized protein n=1 Tax=Cercopithifilaria johnstoni TaxID=2874296 RepID=A0A8J2LVV9_9BILA|nr:unnamed protein product [Cercopithifilaria johnstoni]